MGLKLHCYCNILTSWLKNKHDAGALIFSTQDSWIDLNGRLLKLAASTGFDQVHGSMDRLLEQNNRDCVRNTMIRQEEIFKGQVHELHRLYRVQRMLMAELKIKEPQIHPIAATDMKNKYWSSTSTSETSHSSQISNIHPSGPQVKSEYNSLHQHSMLAEDEATIARVKPKEVWADEECDVELSLSIGCSSSKKQRPKNWLTSETRQLVVPNTGARPQRPPWIFHATSLDRT